MNPPSEYAVLGKMVSFADIDHELSNMSAGESKVRASLMNLVIFSSRPKSLLTNREILKDLMEIQACRGILVELNANAPDNSSFAWIDAYCRLMGGSKTVCNEQLSFWLNGHMRGRIPNSVFAHLDSDLPLIFWWQGKLTPVFRPRLYKRMNRFLFDSSEWEDPGASYQRIIAAYQDTYHQMIPHDLEWGRTFYLRLGISKLFDEPAALAVLGDIDSLRIKYNPSNIVAVVWLLTWISSQCRWKFKSSADKKCYFTTDDGRNVTVVLIEDQSAVCVSEIVFFTGEHFLSLKRENAHSAYDWAINLPALEIEKILPADPVCTTELVAGQIARGGRNSIFSSLLSEFSQLWSALEPDF